MRALRTGFAIAAALWVMSMASAASALTIFLPENASYRYVNATAATTIPVVPPDWFTPGFDDSSWSVGLGAFGTSFGGNLANANAPYAPGPTLTFPGNTAWSVNLDPYLRATFMLPAPTALTVWIAVDNGVNSYFLNGVQATGAINAEGTANRWEHVFDVPAIYTFPGINTIALQLEDHGVATGFAMVITSDDTDTNPPITNNPPPQQPPPTNDVPEPATFALLGLGLLGLAASRRRGAR